MARPAPTRMTLETFLAFDDGTDTRYELIEGELVAMAPPAPAHARITSRLHREIGNRLAKGCESFAGGGVARPDRPFRCFVPDLLVTGGRCGLKRTTSSTHAGGRGSLAEHAARRP